MNFFVCCYFLWLFFTFFLPCFPYFILHDAKINRVGQGGTCCVFGPCLRV